MKNVQPLLSILIITYNRPKDMLDLLKSIQSQNEHESTVGEVLILNNASDVSYQRVEKFIADNPHIPFRFIDFKENLGVARGRNFLIRRARFPLLLVLDDDIIFEDKDALATAMRLFDSPFFAGHNTAVITLNIHYYDTGERQKNALPHKKYRQYKDKSQFLTSYFIGAAHLMKKELFEKTGYYPEDFFYGMEEYDLSYRIINAGYTLGYDDQIKILHKESPEGRVPSRQKLQMMWYNKSIVAYKYLPHRYYYTTIFMWSLFYLKKSGLDFSGWAAGFKKVCKIPGKVMRKCISDRALAYLKSTEARLWY